MCWIDLFVFWIVGHLDLSCWKMDFFAHFGVLRNVKFKMKGVCIKSIWDLSLFSSNLDLYLFTYKLVFLAMASGSERFTESGIRQVDIYMITKPPKPFFNRGQFVTKDSFFNLPSFIFQSLQRWEYFAGLLLCVQ